MADWTAIKTEYITTNTSYRKLADKFGIHYKVIANRGKAEGWSDLRSRHRDKTLTKAVNAVSNKQAERTAKLIGVSDLLLDRVKSLLEADGDILSDTSVMKDVSVILKNLKDIQMIRSEEDLREQEARIEKLRKEASVEEKTPKIEITLGGGLEDYAR